MYAEDWKYIPVPDLVYVHMQSVPPWKGSMYLASHLSFHSFVNLTIRSEFFVYAVSGCFSRSLDVFWIEFGFSKIYLYKEKVLQSSYIVSFNFCVLSAMDLPVDDQLRLLQNFGWIEVWDAIFYDWWSIRTSFSILLGFVFALFLYWVHYVPVNWTKVSLINNVPMLSITKIFIQIEQP